MKNQKKLISMLLALTLCVSCMTLLSGADGEFSGTLESGGAITSELLAVMEAASATEKIPVSIWTEEINADEVEQLALEESGYNRDSIRALAETGGDADLTAEEVDAYIEAERRIYSEMQQQASAEFIAQYAFLQTASTADGAYVCSYAPMMLVELTSAQIQALAGDSAVCEVAYAPEMTVVDEMNISVPLVSADYMRDDVSHGYSGSGIKIGQLETGVPDQSKFEEGQIEINTDSNIGVSEHATAVAEIMISNGTYKGIVPDATLYSTGSNASPSTFYEGVEWLISKNVHVINMSSTIGVTNSVGKYSEIEQWLDHIALNHSVHFVKSAGNQGYKNSAGTIVFGKVTTPGLAYNIITVGNLDDNNTAAMFDDTLELSSSFLEVINSTGLMPTNKPDLVAPGTSIRTSSFPNALFSDNDDVTGTSFAAPHVTGIVAQLMQAKPALKVLQDAMKAILTASVSHSVHRYASATQGFEQYGAGVANALESYRTANLGNYRSSNFSAGSSNTYKSYTFSVDSSVETVRVSLTWLKYAYYSSSDHVGTTVPTYLANLTDLDLAIIAPDGTELPLNAMCNNDDYNNLVLIQFDPATYGYGTYTIEVWLRGEMLFDGSDVSVQATGQRTYFSVAWWKES